MMADDHIPGRGHPESMTLTEPNRGDYHACQFIHLPAGVQGGTAQQVTIQFRAAYLTSSAHVQSQVEAALMVAWANVIGQFEVDANIPIVIRRLPFHTPLGANLVPQDTVQASIDGSLITVARDGYTLTKAEIDRVASILRRPTSNASNQSNRDSLDDDKIGVSFSFFWASSPSQLDKCLSSPPISGSMDFHLTAILVAEQLYMTLKTPAAWGGRLAHCLIHALEASVRALERAECLKNLPLIGAADHEIVELANSTTDTSFGPSNIPEAFAQQASNHPERMAIVAIDRQLTFDGLDIESSIVASRLLKEGVRPGDTIAVLAERTSMMIVAFLGILKAGAIYMPLNLSFPSLRIQRMLEKVSCGFLLTDRNSVVETFHASDELKIFLIPEILRPDTGSGPVFVFPDSKDGAYLIFTSGSTGQPKGVLVEHGSAMNLVSALSKTVYARLESPLKISVAAPFSFDASIKQMLRLVSGDTLYVIPDEIRQDPEQFVAYLSEHSLDALECTPSFLKVLIRYGLNNDFNDLPKLFLIGGEACDRETWRYVCTWSRTRAFNTYGPTETTVLATVAEFTTSKDRPVLGFPLPNVQIYVLDEYMRQKTVGAPGELYIGGSGLARCYFNDPALTSSRFVHSPFIGGGTRLYRSGDIGYRCTDGRLIYVGRRDHEVKLGGRRVDTNEVASVLKEHPSVSDAIVVPDEDGGGNIILRAYIVDKFHPTAVETVISTGYSLASINRDETVFLFEEIFQRRCYLPREIAIPRDAVVFDIGANIGMFSLFAGLLAPDGRIFSFEPLPPIFHKLKLNCARYIPNAKPYCVGISDRTRSEAFLYYPGYSVMSGQMRYANSDADIKVVHDVVLNAHGPESTQHDSIVDHLDEILAARFTGSEFHCQLRRFSDVLEELNVEQIDLLKIDVQRAELDVLAGLDSHQWDTIQQIVMEVHDGSMDKVTLSKLNAMFRLRGFRSTHMQESRMRGSDRHSVVAWRPGYREHIGQMSRPPSTSGIFRRQHSPLTPDVLKTFARTLLPEYMVPKSVVLLGELPLTPEGKVDVNRLPKTTEITRTFVAPPATPLEERLLSIWRAVLENANVGVTDGLFDLGVDSIQSISLQSSSRDNNISFSLKDLFSHPTVRSLAAFLETGRNDG